MTKKSEDDIEFASLFKDVSKVVHDKYVPSRHDKRQTWNKAKSDYAQQHSIKEHKQLAASVAISDEFEAHWPEDKAISFMREHDREHKDLLKRLKMGYFPPDIEMDLHGLIASHAKEELVSAIFEAKKRNSPCINIIHGHGNGVLKRKIPNWLVQHPDVIAFIKAPKAYGGNAGLLVLVGIDAHSYKV